MRSSVLFLTAGLALVAGAASLQASVITTSYLGVTDDGSSMDPSDFDASSSNDALIVLMGTKKRPGGATVTYGTSALTEAVTKESGSDGAMNQATIYYLLNPTNGTDTISYTFASTSGNSTQRVYALYADGVAQQAPEATGVAESPTGGAGSPPLTLDLGPISVTADALAVDVFSRFNKGNPDGGLGNKQENAATAISYAVQGSAGDLTSNWTWTDSKSDSNKAMGAIASFAAVPEPTTLALLGFGGLGMLVRRRRRA